MPRLSDSMTEGTIVRWLKAEGDEVERGEEIVEVETDKATVGYEAEVSGRLSIREPEGAVVAVGGAHRGDRRRRARRRGSGGRGAGQGVPAGSAPCQ